MSDQTITEWTDEDLAFEADTCPACGGHITTVRDDALDQALDRKSVV